MSLLPAGQPPSTVRAMLLEVSALGVNGVLPLPAARGEGGVRGPSRMRGAKIAKTDLARRLRRSSTVAEKRLWKYLRSRALLGFKFVRQEPIGPYIMDFVCRERRLVIEVDGGQHATDKRDAIRDQW